MTTGIDASLALPHLPTAFSLLLLSFVPNSFFLSSPIYLSYVLFFHTFSYSSLFFAYFNYSSLSHSKSLSLSYTLSLSLSITLSLQYSFSLYLFFSFLLSHLPFLSFFDFFLAVFFFFVSHSLFLFSCCFLYNFYNPFFVLFLL